MSADVFAPGTGDQNERLTFHSAQRIVELPSSHWSASMPPQSRNSPDVATAWLVRPLHHSDIASLTSILREHIRDLHSSDIVETEVQAVISYMRGMADALGRTRRYLVAVDRSEQLLGCMAMAVPDPAMAIHLDIGDTPAVELLNAFVGSRYMRGKGVGLALFSALCEAAATDGARYLLVNSGPRYRNSWGFYDRVCDTSHGFIDNYYGPSRHAKTCKKNLHPHQ